MDNASQTDPPGEEGLGAPPNDTPSSETPPGAQQQGSGLGATIKDTIQNTNPLFLVLLLVVVISMLTMLLLSIFYIIRVFGDITTAGLQKNPLNIQSFDQKAAVALQKKMNRYLVIVLLPFIIVGIALVSLVMMFRYPASMPSTPLVKLIMVVFLLLGVPLVILQLLLYLRARKQLRPIQDRIRVFNLYVNRRVTKDSAFLSRLLNVNTNPFLSKDVIRDALSNIAPGVSAEVLAQYLFTVNLYSHYQKLGPRNPYFQQAMEVFLPLNILNLDRFRPSDYLYSSITFIEDVSTSFIGTASTTALPQALFKDAKKVNDAAVLANQWTSEATNLANGFYARDAVYPYMNLVVLMALVQVLVLLPILWLLWKPERRKAILDFLARALGPKIAA